VLSVVLDPDGDVVCVHADAAGIQRLETVVVRLKEGIGANDCPHAHLMSESWGGRDLTETMLGQEQEKGCRQVHHVKIYGWNDEWAHKHGLKKV
jgi:hypothetical protein